MKKSIPISLDGLSWILLAAVVYLAVSLFSGVSEAAERVKRRRIKCTGSQQQQIIKRCENSGDICYSTALTEFRCVWPEAEGPLK